MRELPPSYDFMRACSWLNSTGSWPSSLTNCHNNKSTFTQVRMAVFLALPIRQLALLRTEQHAKEKNKEMMRKLWEQAWFVAYRLELEKYRAGKAPRPVFPDGKVEVIEKEVDKWLRDRHPGYKRA